MSLKKIEDVKSNKFFKIGDLIIYAILAVIIVALFLSIFLTADKSPLSGIGIYYKNEVVFSYSFESDEYTIVSPDIITVEEDTEESLTVTYCIEDKGWHNTIFIDKSAVTVAVTDADCNGKDCMLTTIKDKSSTIVCTPHALKIIPEDYEDNDDGENLPVG